MEIDMTKQLDFDVFISYRRDSGEIMGRLLYELLKDKYNVFFDHESLSSGRFDIKLLKIINGCKDVIIILSEGCLERCKNKDDWFMCEMKCALESNKNIVLLIMDGFHMPSDAELEGYPEELKSILKYNGHMVKVAYIDNVISKLCHDMVTPQRQNISSFDSLTEWRTFSQCIAEKRFADFLPGDIKSEILHNAISSFMDEYNGQILGSMLDRMNGAQNVRTKYRYEISLEKGFRFRLVDIDEDKYYMLSESLYYSKKFLRGKPSGKFLIAFVTNLDELDGDLRDENFFFSENLPMDREDIKLLAELDSEDKMSFYTSSLRVKININGSVLTPERVIIDEGGIVGEYALDPSLIEDTDTLDVKIQFRVPQHYSSSYFFASINDPTYSPFIRFNYFEDEFGVKMIPFLNREVTSKDSKVFDGLRELSIENEWIMPVSGVFFIISPK